MSRAVKVNSRLVQRTPCVSVSKQKVKKGSGYSWVGECLPGMDNALALNPSPTPKMQ